MRRRILLVHTNENIRNVWKFLFETRGYAVHTAASGPAAILESVGTLCVVCSEGIPLPELGIPIVRVGDRANPVLLLEQVRLATRRIKGQAPDTEAKRL